MTPANRAILNALHGSEAHQCPGCGGTGCDAVSRCQYCGRTSGYRSHVVAPGPMTPAERRRLRQEWERIHRGNGQTVVLPYIAPTASEKVRM